MSHRTSVCLWGCLWLCRYLECIDGGHGCCVLSPLLVLMQAHTHRGKRRVVHSLSHNTPQRQRERMIRCTHTHNGAGGWSGIVQGPFTHKTSFPSPGLCVIIGIPMGIPMGLSACWHLLGFLPALVLCFLCVCVCLCVVVPVLPRVVRRRPRSPRSR